MDDFSDRGFLTPPCPTPQRDGLQAGLIGVLLFFKKNEARSLSHCGDTKMAGHQPRECRDEECGDWWNIESGKDVNRVKKELSSVYCNRFPVSAEIARGIFYCKHKDNPKDLHAHQEEERDIEGPGKFAGRERMR